jgi:hypothetical protein
VLVVFKTHWPKLIFAGVTLCGKAVPAISKIVARHSAGRLSPPVESRPFLAHEAAASAMPERAGAGQREYNMAR